MGGRTKKPSTEQRWTQTESSSGRTANTARARDTVEVRERRVDNLGSVFSLASYLQHVPSRAQPRGKFSSHLRWHKSEGKEWIWAQAAHRLSLLPWCLVLQGAYDVLEETKLNDEATKITKISVLFHTCVFSETLKLSSFFRWGSRIRELTCLNL